MSEATSIPFAKALDDSIALRRIAWWRPASRFVVVQYAKDGHNEEYGKRLDLDKRAFLDGFDDWALDAKLETLIPEIVQTVADWRNQAAHEEAPVASALNSF